MKITYLHYVKYFISILRPINLSIVALSQLAVYFLFIAPLFTEYNIDRQLCTGLIWLFILDTVLIAAGGYIINDIKDIHTDRINKVTKTYLGPDKISLKTAWYYYAFIVVTGGIIAYYIAVSIGKPLLLIIYPIAVIMLYFYSTRWKMRPLTGNIVVSLFCAFVPGIIWYAESDGMSTLHDQSPSWVLLFGAYILFGFLITLVREIVKDLEDIEGDKYAGHRTLPIAVGPERAKSLAVFTAILLISSYGFWLLALWRAGYIYSLVLVILCVLLPTLYVITILSSSRTKADFSRISQYLKVIMLVSLIVFITIVFLQS